MHSITFVAIYLMIISNNTTIIMGQNLGNPTLSLFRNLLKLILKTVHIFRKWCRKLAEITEQMQNQSR